MIGELAAQKQIAEIPKSVWSDTELLNNKEMLRHAKRTNVRLGRSTWAVPLGSPQLVMFYRQDVLDALGSKVPTTWEEFDRLIEKLKATQTLSDDSGNDLPTTAAFPLKDDWAVTTYLARVAASVRSRGKLSILFDRNTMEPLIETTPFVEALNQLKAYNEGESPDRWQSPGDVYREMVEGRLAVAITWPSAHFTRNEDGSGFDESKVIDAIKIARLPGSIRYFDGSDKGWTERDRADSHHVDLVGFEGFVASFNQKSGHSLTAHEFLKWLPSKSISLTTMTESKHSGPFRASHLGNPFRWTGGAISPDTAQQYSDVIRQVNSDQSVVFLFPHITGHALYLDALNNAVQQCLSGETDASGALKQAAAKWREITEQLDVGQQRANLRKAQGI